MLDMGAIMRCGLAAVGALSLTLAGCNILTVREGVLSTNQRVAMVSSPGDGISPPTNVVLFEDKSGKYVPVSTGYAPAPVTALVAGAGAGIAIGAGTYGAARVARPAITNVIQRGASATGSSSTATATGGSASVVSDVKANAAGIKQSN